MRRTHFIFHIAGQWDGIDTENLVNKTIYRNRTANRMVPRITGKIVRRDRGIRRRSARRQGAYQRAR